MEYRELPSGEKVPMIGLGTFRSEREECVHAVETAIGFGYRYIDTANFYENEQFVGEGVRRSGIGREEVFLLSKIWPTSFEAPGKAVDYSLKTLGVEYIDMYLLHWPGTDETARYHAFETLLRRKEKGDIREIGVSNFKKHHIEGIIREFGFAPAMNQVEISPWLQKGEDAAFCEENRIVVTVSVPFAKGKLLSEKKLIQIAEKHRKKVSQIILRWNIQKGRCVVPKSTKANRIRENLQIFDFVLDDEDMGIIEGMENGNHYCSDSDGFTGDFWKLEDIL